MNNIGFTHFKVRVGGKGHSNTFTTHSCHCHKPVCERAGSNVAIFLERVIYKGKEKRQRKLDDLRKVYALIYSQYMQCKSDVNLNRNCDN